MGHSLSGARSPARSPLIRPSCSFRELKSSSPLAPKNEWVIVAVWGPLFPSASAVPRRAFYANDGLAINGLLALPLEMHELEPNFKTVLWEFKRFTVTDLPCNNARGYALFSRTDRRTDSERNLGFFFPEHLVKLTRTHSRDSRKKSPGPRSHVCKAISGRP